MNYYERIQNSLNYIEANLDNEMTIEDCASEAFMSVSGYYRMFLSIVGYSVKEYIRLRRLSLAYADLQAVKPASVTEVAFKYMYNSNDSFSRAFKKQFGILPSHVKKSSSNSLVNKFERIDIMSKYFEEDKQLLEKYPDIKVIKELEEMKVACYTYFGPDPEGHAFEVIKKWVHENHISMKDTGCRIFGYNNPDPSDVDDASELYGYEVCITIPDSLYEKLEDIPNGFTKGTYDGVKRRVLQGGKYAIMSVRRDAKGDIGTNIMHAWKRFNKWLQEGKYVWGGRQYLEEHLGFNEMDDHIGGVELYLPIEDAPRLQDLNISEMNIPKCRTAMFREEGEDPEAIAVSCWKRVIEWAKQAGLKSEDCRIFQYNKGFDRRPPFYHVIMVAVPDGFNEAPFAVTEVTFTDFSGGKFMVTATDITNLGNTWMMMERWRKESGVKLGDHQWVEEWILENWKMPAKRINVCYPI